MPTSQNGYSANDRSVIKTYYVDGEPLPMREGPAGELLHLLATWLHNNVESISKGHQADDWGYAERPIRGSTTTLSNHASGTAFDFNATQHPLGVWNTWSPRQRRKIRRFLRNQLEHTVRAGLDYKNRPDDMHFEINDDLEEVARVLRKLKGAGPKKKVRRIPIVDLGNVREQFVKGGTEFSHGVKAIQRELNARGEELAVDGYAGPSTRQALQRFQKQIKARRTNGLPTWWQLRVLGGVLPTPSRLKFRVKK